MNAQPQSATEPRTARRKWTTDLPTADGWYAFRFDHDWPPSFVMVFADHVYLVGTEGPYQPVSRVRGHWWGPIDVATLTEGGCSLP